MTHFVFSVIFDCHHKRHPQFSAPTISFPFPLKYLRRAQPPPPPQLFTWNSGTQLTILSPILRPTVGRPVCLGIKHPSGAYAQIFITVAGLLMWDAFSNERADLSFTIAAGPRQRSHIQVRVSWNSWPYFTVSDSRLPFSSPPTLTAVDRKSSILWDIIPCSPLKISRRFGGKCRLEQSSPCYLFYSGFLIALSFDPDDGDNMLLRNVCWLLADYIAFTSQKTELFNGWVILRRIQYVRLDMEC
jgi:hypothetical protein